jgi:hypothetical protein
MHTHRRTAAGGSPPTYILTVSVESATRGDMLVKGATVITACALLGGCCYVHHNHATATGSFSSATPMMRQYQAMCVCTMHNAQCTTADIICFQQ